MRGMSSMYFGHGGAHKKSHFYFVLVQVGKEAFTYQKYYQEESILCKDCISEMPEGGGISVGGKGEKSCHPLGGTKGEREKFFRGESFF